MPDALKALEQLLEQGFIEKTKKITSLIIPETGISGKIVQGKSEYTLRLLPGEGQKIFYTEETGGYRGGAKFEIAHIFAGDVAVYRMPLYQSEQGNLGIGEETLFVLAPGTKILVHMHQWGRLYGDNPDYVAVLDWEHGWGEWLPMLPEEYLEMKGGEE